MNIQTAIRQNWISREQAEATGGVILGRLKWYDPHKGYGFIVPDDGSPDVFFRFHEKNEAGFELDDFDDGIPMACSKRETADGKWRAREIWRLR